LLLSAHVAPLGRASASEVDAWSASHPGASKAAITQFKSQFSIFRAVSKAVEDKTENQFAVLVMLFVLSMYLLTAISTVLASFAYIPLLCRIRGNLKEYVCHLIDKRIGELMKRKARKRIQKQQAELALYGSTKGYDSAPRAELPVLGDVPISPRSTEFRPIQQRKGSLPMSMISDGGTFRSEAMYTQNFPSHSSSHSSAGNYHRPPLPNPAPVNMNNPYAGSQFQSYSNAQVSGQYNSSLGHSSAGFSPQYYSAGNAQDPAGNFNRNPNHAGGYTAGAYNNAPASYDNHRGYS
jgi:hypothetical protein